MFELTGKKMVVAKAKARMAIVLQKETDLKTGMVIIFAVHVIKHTRVSAKSSRM